MELLYDRGDEYYGQVFGYLMIAFVFACAPYIYGSLLVANNNLKLFNIIAGLNVVLNICLNWFWIQQSGALGAAMATLITQAFATILQFLYVYRIFQFKATFKGGFRISLFVLGSTGIFYLLYQYPIQWILALFIASGLSLVWALILGVLTIQPLKLIRKSF